MISDNLNTIQDQTVSVASLQSAYRGLVDEEVRAAVRSVCDQLGWGDGSRGALGGMIPQGARVVVKPNFVLHSNQRNGGLLPLITHPSLVTAVVDEVLRSGPSSVLVGDAPIQSCDFTELLRVTGLGNWARSLESSDNRFKGIVDFRRTIAKVDNGVRYARENVQSEENYVLFDLGADSLLEPITDHRGGFRVTSYDPRLLAKAHSPGRHQYLIAKEVLEADVVVNLPKLKTHKKAGITCALKNLVGINGNKEYLPHHRVGGSASGGDCYPGRSVTKRVLEYVLDRQNMSGVRAGQKFYSGVADQLERTIRLIGDHTGVEGSWVGNETVPRMTLDLNRILLYGRVDGTMSSEIQRRVLSIVDAVIAGQGDGPLASDPLELGKVIAGQNPAAIDWIGAQLLTYEPERIPLLNLAFGGFKWPIADFSPDEIRTLNNDSETLGGKIGSMTSSLDVTVPAGWKAAVSKGL